MAKRQPAKKPTPPPVTDLSEFQSAYGGEYAKIVAHPAFLAGMQLLNVRKMNEIALLTDGDIVQRGREILASLRGHLQHENDLISLHKKQEFALPFEEEEQYLSPEAVGEVQA